MIESDAWFDNYQKERFVQSDSVFSIYGSDWKMTMLFQVHKSKYIRLALGQDVITIGRDVHCTIIYSQATISKQHCTLYCQKGEWYIKNNSQANGTYVNNQRISEKKLEIGDCIFVVGYEIWFCECFLLVTQPDQTSLSHFVTKLNEPCVQQIQSSIQIVQPPLMPELKLPKRPVNFTLMFQEVFMLWYMSLYYQQANFMVMMIGLRLMMNSLQLMIWLCRYIFIKHRYKKQLSNYHQQQHLLYPNCLELEQRFLGMQGLLQKTGDVMVRLGMLKNNEILLHNFTSYKHVVMVGHKVKCEYLLTLLVYQIQIYYPHISMQLEKTIPSFCFCTARLKTSDEILWIGSKHLASASYWIEIVSNYDEAMHGYDAFIDLNENKYYCGNEMQDFNLDDICIDGLFSRHFRQVKKTQQHTSFKDYYQLIGLHENDITTLRQKYDVSKELKGCIGSNENQKMYLDLHEQHDGPHLLVAGMTGSGKSEWLIGYLLSLAIYYDSCDIQFFFIDFKGGGLSSSFENLAHTTMILTDLEKQQIKRAIAALQDEITYRETLFLKIAKQFHYPNVAIHDVKRLYASGLIKTNIAHLLIVVDEFAELKLLYPEMMQALIRIARIGRSLGIHLLLATQRPGGIVDGQILGNIKAKVCLKVASKQDSYDIFGKHTSSFLTSPGEFYLQRELQGELERGKSMLVEHQYQTMTFYNFDFVKIQELPLEPRKTELLPSLISEINVVSTKIKPLYYKSFDDIKDDTIVPFQLGYYDDFKHRLMLKFVHDLSKDGSLLIVGANQEILNTILSHYPNHQICSQIDKKKDNLTYVFEDMSSHLKQDFMLGEKLKDYLPCIFIEKENAHLPSRLLEMADVKLFFDNEALHRYMFKLDEYECDQDKMIGCLIKNGEVYNCQIKIFNV